MLIQQLPCTGGTEIDVRPAMGNDDAASARAAQAGAPGTGNNQAILAGIGQRRPVVGMTDANLRMAMGTPTRTNSANYSGRQSDQLIFERDTGTWYVYVREGMVSSIQFQEAIRREPSRTCPNSLQIRNMETSASSITISREQKRALQRQIAAAKACS